MLLYNVTDKSLPRQNEPLNLTLNKGGMVFAPGRCVETKDTFSKGQIAGWIHAGWIAVNELPDWYKVKKEKQPPPRSEPKPEIRLPRFLEDTPEEG